MRGRFYLDTMHVDCANLSRDIFRFDGPIWKPDTPLRPLKSQDHFYDMQ